MSSPVPPPPSILSPLNDTHLESILAGLKWLDLLDPELKKAQQAGIDVTQKIADSQAARQRLLQLKNVYFPNR
jgi:hypothetical protein